MSEYPIAQRIVRSLTQGGMYLWDCNTRTGEYDYCEQFRQLMGLPMSGPVPESVMEKYLVPEFASNVSKRDETDIIVFPVRLNGVIVWLEFKRLSVYTDSDGVVHHCGISRKLSPPEADRVLMQNGISIYSVQKLLKGLQRVVAGDGLGYGTTQFVNDLKHQLGEYRVLVFAWTAYESFKCIEAVGVPVLRADGVRVERGVTVRSALIEHICMSGQTFSCERVKEIDSAWQFDRLFTIRNYEASLMASPIKLADGNTLGILVVVKESPTKWTAFDRHWIETLAIGFGICQDQENSYNDSSRQLQLNYIACRNTRLVTWILDAKTLRRTTYTYHIGAIRKTELDNESFLQQIHPDDVELYRRNIALITTGSIDRVKMRMRCESTNDHEMMWYDITAKVLDYGSDALPQTIVGTARNINDEVLEEQKNQTEQKLTQLVYDQLPTAMAIYDEHGSLSYANQAAKQMYDDSKRETALANLFQNPLLSDADKKRIATYDTNEFNLTVNPSGHEDVDIVVRVQKLYIDSKFSGYLTSMVPNALVASQKRQMAFFDNYINDLGTMLKLGIYQSYNGISQAGEQWNRNLGLDPAKKAHKHISEYVSIHPDDRRELCEYYDRLISGLLSQFQFTVRVRENDAESRNKYSRWLKLIFKRNAMTGAINGASIDITERKATEDLLIQAREKAERMDSLKLRFVANISHEIRTPLNAILGFSDLIVDASDADERRQYARIINNNTDVLLKLISDIMDLSEIESGTMNFNYAECKPFDLCQRLYRKMVGKTIGDVALIFQPWEQFRKMSIYCDAARVNQILNNFITNSIKFTNKGRIVLWYEIKDDKVVFHVSDTGIGIEKDKINTIFEEFVKLDTFSVGTGLGLPLCRSIAKQMGGAITVESTPGVGSHFCLHIPYIQSEDFEHAVGEGLGGGHHQVITEILRRQRRIVLLESDQDTMFYLSNLLSPYEVSRAKAEGFMDFWLDRRPLLTILDVRFCRDIVLNVVQCIRSYDKGYKIIALNSPETGISGQVLLSAGVNTVLQLPLSVEQFREAANKYINI